jgi:hypothetical protein
MASIQGEDLLLEDQDLLFETYTDHESMPTSRSIEWLDGHRDLFRLSKQLPLPSNQVD